MGPLAKLVRSARRIGMGGAMALPCPSHTNPAS